MDMCKRREPHAAEDSIAGEFSITEEWKFSSKKRSVSGSFLPDQKLLIVSRPDGREILRLIEARQPRNF